MADNDLTVHIEPAQRSGVYSNAVSVTINTNEVVVDFGYLVPNTTSPEVVVVSRVTMHPSTAKNFMGILERSFADFESRQTQAAAPQQAPVQAPVMPQPMMDPMAMQAPVQAPVMPQPMMDPMAMQAPVQAPVMPQPMMDPMMSPAPGIPPYPSV